MWWTVCPQALWPWPGAGIRGAEEGEQEPRRHSHDFSPRNPGEGPEYQVLVM